MNADASTIRTWRLRKSSTPPDSRPSSAGASDQVDGERHLVDAERRLDLVERRRHAVQRQAAGAERRKHALQAGGDHHVGGGDPLRHRARVRREPARRTAPERLYMRRGSPSRRAHGSTEAARHLDHHVALRRQDRAAQGGVVVGARVSAFARASPSAPRRRLRGAGRRGQRLRTVRGVSWLLDGAQSRGPCPAHPAAEDFTRRGRAASSRRRGTTSAPRRPCACRG